MDPLREALASHEDLEVIRRLCEGGKVPEGLRADLWKVIQLMCLVSSFSKCYVNIVITRLALALPFFVHKQSPCVSYTTVPPVLISSHMHPQECLGVSRRPDALGSWSGPLDCENQETIHTQCLQQTGKRGRWEVGEERGEEKR